MLTCYLCDICDKVHVASKHQSDDGVLRWYITEVMNYLARSERNSIFLRKFDEDWVNLPKVEELGYPATVPLLHAKEWMDMLEQQTNNTPGGGLQARLQRSIAWLIQTELVGAANNDTLLDDALRVFGKLEVMNRPYKTLAHYLFYAPLLEAISDLFNTIKVNIVSNMGSILDYLDEARLLEARVSALQSRLPRTFGKTMYATFREIIIKSSWDMIMEGFPSILDNRETEYPIRVCQGLKHAMDFHILGDILLTHAREAGRAKIETLLSTESLNAETFVRGFSELFKKYRTWLDSVFHDIEDIIDGDEDDNVPDIYDIYEIEDIRDINDKFRSNWTDTINETEYVGFGPMKSTELVERFMDSAIRKGPNVDEHEFSTDLDAAVTILEFVDKIFFLKLYMKGLATRIFDGNMSDSHERLALSKLRELLSEQSIGHLENMLKDVEFSRKFTTDCRETHGTSSEWPAAEVTYWVASATQWYLAPTTKTHFRLPKPVTDAFDKAQRSYESFHKDGRLLWLPHYFSGELEVNLPTHKDKTYTFEVSMYQMCVLLLFNDADFLTYQQIRNATTYEIDVLDQVLASLTQPGVLLESCEIDEQGRSTRFYLNKYFESKDKVVKLNTKMIGDIPEAKIYQGVQEKNIEKLEVRANLT